MIRSQSLNCSKMAPTSAVACRRSSLFFSLFVFYVFFYVLIHSCQSLRIYDSTTLLQIRSQVVYLAISNVNKCAFPYHTLPPYLRRSTTGCVCCRRKRRRRRRGRRAGAHVRQRFRRGSSVEVQIADDAGNTDRAVDLRGWRCSFLLPVYPDGGSSVLRFLHDTKISSHRRGVCLSNLSCPKTVKLGAITAAPTVLHTLQMALLNARSVLNKTFILNDFILHNALDFLFITETWIKGDE